MFTKNLCFVIKKLVEMDVASGVYNVADDQALSTIEVVTVLAKSTGKKPLFMATPKFLVMGLAKIGDLLKLPLNTERLSKLTENYEVCNQKIIKALNINLPLKASEGLSLTANSFKNKE